MRNYLWQDGLSLLFCTLNCYRTVSTELNFCFVFEATIVIRFWTSAITRNDLCFCEEHARQCSFIYILYIQPFRETLLPMKRILYKLVAQRQNGYGLTYKMVLAYFYNSKFSHWYIGTYVCSHEPNVLIGYLWSPTSMACWLFTAQVIMFLRKVYVSF